jgi:hypothetical protein
LRLSSNRQRNKSPSPPALCGRIRRNGSGIRASYSRAIIRRRTKDH